MIKVHILPAPVSTQLLALPTHEHFRENTHLTCGTIQTVFKSAFSIANNWSDLDICSKETETKIETERNNMYATAKYRFPKINSQKDQRVKNFSQK